ncbi:MAG: helix-turn-helix domain-containing protein [Candidatus Saccharimonadales bacterium]
MEIKQPTPIEQYVIERIKKIRIEKGFSQRRLENEADFPNGFIGRIESPKWRVKYNLNHLNKIAKVLKCSIKDFFPEKPLK